MTSELSEQEINLLNDFEIMKRMSQVFDEAQAGINFRRETTHQWIEDTKPLYDLAAEYHKRCDEYDVYICGNPEGMPATAQQRGIVTRHARAVLKQLKQRQVDKEIHGDLLKEIQRQA